jgi:hypothetical protein
MITVVNKKSMFQVALDTATVMGGYVVFSLFKDSDASCTLLHFPTTKEFFEHFNISRHSLYPAYLIRPKGYNKIDLDDDFEMQINGETIVLNLNEMYLAKNGKILKPNVHGQQQN